MTILNTIRVEGNGSIRLVNIIIIVITMIIIIDFQFGNDLGKDLFYVCEVCPL